MARAEKIIKNNSKPRQKKGLLINVSTYLDSISAQIENQAHSPDKFKFIQLFLNSVIDWSSHNKDIGASMTDVFEHCDSHASTKLKLQLLDMLAACGSQFQSLSSDALKGILKIQKGHKRSKILQHCAKCVGIVSHGQERACRVAVPILIDLCRPGMCNEVLIEAIHSLKIIGQTWTAQKRIFEPLMGLLSSQDPLIRIETIRAIKTQIEGYWEKPAQLLRETILYDDDLLVRTEAVTVLGDLGLYSAVTIREAIYELVQIVSQQVLNLKSEYIKQEKNGKQAHHIRYRLRDSKEVLKVLYHYVRVYHCR